MIFLKIVEKKLLSHLPIADFEIPMKAILIFFGNPRLFW